ncbi:Probable 6-phosphogluconolactonase 1 [Striga hermonthica]|uniref:Probable 6-phosphogluconolactonase 1 n=1 Tax=Striga hermonthica TaxID=68872 RepID=A0A9N7MW37_STRHE|nr:Probable 6-phosphogluconolactonase 1 [Striga hermonthica]
MGDEAEGELPLAMNSAVLGDRHIKCKMDVKELRLFKNVDILISSLIEYIYEILESCIKEQDVLCHRFMPWTCHWPKWRIFWADERAISETNASSNYKFVKVTLTERPVRHFS